MKDCFKWYFNEYYRTSSIMNINILLHSTPLPHVLYSVPSPFIGSAALFLPSMSHFFSSQDSSAGKESACNANAGDLGSIPGLGRSPGEGKGYPVQYSGLENSMDCVVYRVAESQTRLSDFHSTFPHPILSSTFQLLFSFNYLYFKKIPYQERVSLISFP